ncbi:MAG TPA: sugar nucleotidyltransferase, partial [Acidimicrobiales bacterium]|nr:sugar nucleotidyltransferase [Acidimicrobiales bacterium]
MKGLILAGGAGTRLRPITHTSAKQLVPVANKPILFYGLEHMVAAGITEIGMIVGDTRNEIMTAVGDGSRWGIDVTYIPQDSPLGLAHCVLIAREFLGDEHFVMYLGDNLLEQGLREFVDAFATDTSNAAAQILLHQVPDPQRFGVAELNADGEVIRLVEKPVDPPSDLALVGVYLFDPRIHDAVRAIEPSPRGELEITDVNLVYLRAGRLNVRVMGRGMAWLDTGTHESLLQASNFIEAIENRQGLMVGSIEEVAFRMGFIDAEGLLRAAAPFRKNDYGRYL